MNFRNVKRFLSIIATIFLVVVVIAALAEIVSPPCQQTMAVPTMRGVDMICVDGLVDSLRLDAQLRPQ